MSHRYFDIAFTRSVAAAQAHAGSRPQYARAQTQGAPHDALGSTEAAFLERARTFFLATVSASGWPYVQHRGGPPGFLRVLSPTRIAFPDFRGNRQYVSVGNAAADDRVAMIVIDYELRERLKLFGRIRFVDLAAAEPGLARCADAVGDATVERIALIDVAAYDWNCRQHIPKLSSAAR